VRRAILIAIVLGIGAGCAARRMPTFHTVALEGVSYDKAFDAAEVAIARHFEIYFADRKAGVISTRYSTEKSIDSIIKIRAIAVLTKRSDGAVDMHFKVLRERFWERWTGDHELVTQHDFLGEDEDFARRILKEAQKIAAESKQSKK